MSGWCGKKQNPSATASAASDTMIRVRSSSRWPTTLTWSSCESRLGSDSLIVLGLDVDGRNGDGRNGDGRNGGCRHRGRLHRRQLRRGGGLAADRVLEAAEAV